MSWTPPKTDEEWDEVLSAYLDGELTPEETEGVEHRLHSAPELAQRLAVLRATREALRAWRVDASAPDAAFMRALGEAEAAKRNLAAHAGRNFSWQRALRWPAVAAVFACGVLCGVYGTLSLRRDAPTPAPSQGLVEPAQQSHATSVALASAISPAQAQALFREMEAEKVKEQLVGQLRNRDWAAAAALRTKLQADYGDTRASASVIGDRNFELLDKALANTGRAKP